MPAGLKLAEAVSELLRGETATGPAKLFLGFAESEPHHNSSGTQGGTGAGEFKELSYEGYKRREIILAEEEVVAATEVAAQKILNKSTFNLFPNTGTTGRNKAASWFLADAETGGGIWFYGSLSEVIEVIKAMAEVKVKEKELSIGIE